jgi:D-glycero-D-manno-heptose 1,7-bisphosphate phosphatase
MRVLLIDRDGVINEDSADFIRSPADWHALPGSLEAIARAQRLGYHVVVVSNQSGLARGHFSMHDLNEIHARLCAELARFGGRVEAFFFCPHGPDDDCECRKPRAGLLLALRERLGIDLTRTPFIGDRLSDARAARSVGARAMLVRSGLEAPAAQDLAQLDQVEVYDDLSAAVAALA